MALPIPDVNRAADAGSVSKQGTAGPTTRWLGGHVLNRPARPWSWRIDLPTQLALGVLVIALRWPLRARTLNGWDSGSFALAVEDFDVYALRPHAPGYPVYVFAARIVHFFVGDVTQALVALSILCSALAVAFLYGLVRAIGTRTAALGAAVAFSVAPVFVFNGLVALSYTAEAAAGTGIAWLAWSTSQSGTRTKALGLAACLGLAGGLRTSVFLFLAPLVVVVLWRYLRTHARGRALHLTLAISAFGLGTLIWLVPMVWATTGGWAGWQRASSFQTYSVILADTVFNGGMAAYLDHWNRLWFFVEAERRFLVPVFAGVVLGTLAVVGLAHRRGRRLPNPGSSARVALFLFLWAVPSILFYLLIFNGWDRGPTGYALAFLPAVYAGWALAIDGCLRLCAGSFSRPFVRKAIAIAAIPILLAPVPGMVQAWQPSIDELRGHEEWTAQWGALPTRFPPNETAILSYYSWNHVKWYLPDYLQWGIFPVPRGQRPPDWAFVMETRDRTDDQLFYAAHLAGPPAQLHRVPEWVRYVVVFDFQLAGENGEQRHLHDDVNVTEAFLENNWRVLYFEPEPSRPFIEDYLKPESYPR